MPDAGDGVLNWLRLRLFLYGSIGKTDRIYRHLGSAGRAGRRRCCDPWGVVAACHTPVDTTGAPDGRVDHDSHSALCGTVPTPPTARTTKSSAHLLDQS